MCVVGAAVAAASLLLAMASSSSAAGKGPLVGEVGRNMIARSNKSALAASLLELQRAGLLNTDEPLTERGIKRQLKECSEYHANVRTPYGPLVQTMEIGAPNLEQWEFCHPAAFLHYLTVISAPFADLMRSICVEDRPCRVVIYADGLEPGNPFRPEKSRHLQCIYWALADWPQWLLQRTFAWPVFGMIRTAVLETIEGGMSYLMRLVLKVFFADDRRSFSRGVILKHGSSAYEVRAIFGWFLADLEGHRDITRWKGTSGKLMCISCFNVVSKKCTLGDGDVDARCSDAAKFVRRTSADIHAIVDELANTIGTISNTKFDKLQTELGFAYAPRGLLLDADLRQIYHPVEHSLRDWMHVMVGDGVANTEIACVLHTLKEHRMPYELVQEFSVKCNLPRKHGKVDKSWFAPARLRENTIVSFSSIILSMIPIMHMFLERFDVSSKLPDLVTCFTQLHHIVGLFRLGAEDAMKHIPALRRLIEKHHDAVGRQH